jgi:hypothetical protein
VGKVAPHAPGGDFDQGWKFGILLKTRPIVEKIVKKGKNRKKPLDITEILDNKLIKSFGRGMNATEYAGKLNKTRRFFLNLEGERRCERALKEESLSEKNYLEFLE